MAGYATISEKQAGVIFGAWKRGEIEATKEQIGMMYGRYVGRSNPTTDAKAIDVCSKLKAVVDAVFAKDGSATKAFEDFISAHKRNFNDTVYAI